MKEGGEPVTVENTKLGEIVTIKINNGKIKAEVKEICEDIL